jgi:triphosphoribosyl-dephospho-CoA synthetase|tara:strand:- start:143 stop:373 length:231 start_codon:yes stop_codon:yes gene_type:complete
MEHRKEKEQKINLISSSDKDTLKHLVQTLEKVIEDEKISETSLADITMVTSDLTRLKDSYSSRLISWLKQGYHLDY